MDTSALFLQIMFKLLVVLFDANFYDQNDIFKYQQCQTKNLEQDK